MTTLWPYLFHQQHGTRQRVPLDNTRSKSPNTLPCTSRQKVSGQRDGVLAATLAVPYLFLGHHGGTGVTPTVGLFLGAYDHPMAVLVPAPSREKRALLSDHTQHAKTLLATLAVPHWFITGLERLVHYGVGERGEWFITGLEREVNPASSSTNQGARKGDLIPLGRLVVPECAIGIY
jgi:hypothetical protein